MCRLQPQCAITSSDTSNTHNTTIQIFADFFDYGGHHYLIIGDRLSGWVEVLSTTTGTNLGGSVGLIHHLCKFFSTFDVPEELSTDGGPEVMASTTENFLRSWNVRYRVSSAGFSQSNGRAEVCSKWTNEVSNPTRGTGQGWSWNPPGMTNTGWK